MKRAAGVWAVVVGLLLASCIGPAFARSARDLNTEGYRLYQAGKYPEALECFKRAVALDPDYALAHYNLACTLGLVRKRGAEAICTYDAYKPVILDHLETAVRLDPDTLMKMVSDPDLDTIRDTTRYLRLIGLVPDNEDSVRTILARVTWFGQAPGAFGPASGIGFHEDGTLVLWLLDTAGDGVKRIEIAGSFTVSGNRITIRLDRPLDGVVSFDGILMPGGTLDVSGLPGPFTDNPHECEA